MTTVEMMKSTMPEMYSQALDGKGMIFSANFANIIGYTLVAAVGDALRNEKQLDKPTAFAFYDGGDRLLVAGLVKYDPSVDAEHPEGSWSYTWTFDPEDIKDAKVLSLNNVENHRYFVSRAFDKYSMEFRNNFMPIMMNTFIEVLKDWLTSNAKEEEETEFTLTDIFTARCQKEGDEVVMSFEPIGKFVQLIKDDADLQV